MKTYNQKTRFDNTFEKLEIIVLAAIAALGSVVKGEFLMQPLFIAVSEINGDYDGVRLRVHSFMLSCSYLP